MFFLFVIKFIIVKFNNVLYFFFICKLIIFYKFFMMFKYDDIGRKMG